MPTETTEDTSLTATTGTPADVVAQTKIEAQTFRDMLTVLENLATHTHTFYDDYTTVCQCQCQCACSRGTV
jgi:hypothetical protein